ncbi:uncharacterized protein [Linepithema humile]|uniref:uncharacterized protein n=1 Tax=Linepithema humile TaxID=83485 RepID=UPI00351DE769
MRTVPVILHSQLLECLQMILKHRDDAKVPPQNPFLFGIPSDNKKRFKYLRACVLLRTFSEDCGAKLPSSLRGTQLRKHIATCCITLNLSEDQVTDLANFMGHDKNIHKSHYRQPIPELEIIRITQFLEAAQGGTEEENENFNDDSDDNNDDRYENNEVNVESEERNIDNTSLQNNILSRNNIIHTCDLLPSSTPQTICHNVIKLRNFSTNKFTKKHKNLKADFSSTEEDMSINENRKRRSTSPYGRTKRTRWTINERDIVYKEFNTFLSNSKLPSSKDILRVKLNNPVLQNRSVAQIRTWIHNHISGKTKKHTL